MLGGCAKISGHTRNWEARGSRLRHPQIIAHSAASTISTSTKPMPAACRGSHKTPALGRALRRENDRPKLRRVTDQSHAYDQISRVRNITPERLMDITSPLASKALPFRRNALFNKSLPGRRTSRQAPTSTARTTARSPSPGVGHPSATVLG